MDLQPLHDGAYACGVTINDALLWAWSRALHRQLAAAGMAALPVVVSFTVIKPSREMQNRVGAIRVHVAEPGDSVVADLHKLADITKSYKHTITGASWWLTAQVFRVLWALGLNRRLIDRQRSITSLLTNLRGPVQAPSMLGRRVRRAVPLTTLVGNVTTVVAALSYGGRLVVTVVCSPQSAAVVDVLTVDLAAGLATVAK